MDADDPYAIVRVIAHRVPELTDHDLALIEQALTGQMVPPDVLDRVFDVIDALAERLQALDALAEEARLGQAA